MPVSMPFERAIPRKRASPAGSPSAGFGAGKRGYLCAPRPEQSLAMGPRWPCMQRKMAYRVAVRPAADHDRRGTSMSAPILATEPCFQSSSCADSETKGDKNGGVWSSRFSQISRQASPRAALSGGARDVGRASPRPRLHIGSPASTAHEVDVVCIAVVGRAERRSRRRVRGGRRAATCSPLKLPHGDPDHADPAGAPGLGGDPFQDLQAVVVLQLVCIRRASSPSESPEPRTSTRMLA